MTPPKSFRYEERDGSAELDRGTVVSRTETEVVVAGPSGAITIRLDASTELDLDHGALLPGAEIRAEGTLVTGSVRTLTAERLKVLCPGPGVVPDEDVPSEVPVTPVPPIDVG